MVDFQPGDIVRVYTRDGDREEVRLVDLNEGVGSDRWWNVIRDSDGVAGVAKEEDMVRVSRLDDDNPNNWRQDGETLVDAVNPPIVYLAGPISNEPRWKEYFLDAGKRLEEEGFKVLNPAEWQEPPRSVEEYMQEDITRVLQADILYLLPGWEDSRRALVEYQVALETGKEIRYLDGAFRGEPVELRASKLVRNGSRELAYGHPINDMERFTIIVTGVLNDLLLPGVRVPVERGPLIMLALKMSRLVNNPPHDDSRVDLIGWPIVYDRVMQRLGNGPAAPQEGSA